MASLATNIIINSRDNTKSGFDSASRRLRNLEKHSSSTARSMQQIRLAAEKVRRALSVLAVGGVFVGVAASLVETADSMKLIRAKIDLVVESDLEREKVEKRLIEISKATRSELSANAALFNKVSVATKDYGATSEQVLLFTEQLNKSLKISSATNVEAASTVLQLGQALASGRLQGDEFRAVNEASTHTISLLAKEMGVARGALKELSSAGKITTEVMFNALINSAIETNRQFEQIPVTVAGAVQNLKTSYESFIGDTDESTNATTNLALGINSLADNFDHVVGLASTFGSVMAGSVLINLIKAYEAKRIDTIITKEQIAANKIIRTQTLTQLGLDKIALKASTEATAAEITRLEAKIARSKNERIQGLDTAKLTKLVKQQKIEVNQLGAAEARHARVLEEDTLARRRNTVATRAAAVATKLLGKAFAALLLYDVAKMAADWLHGFETIRVGVLYVAEGIELFRKNLEILTSPTQWFLNYRKGLNGISKTHDEFDKRREATTDKYRADLEKNKTLDAVIAQAFSEQGETKLKVSERLTKALGAQSKKMTTLAKKSTDLNAIQLNEFEEHVTSAFEKSKDHVVKLKEELSFTKKILDSDSTEGIQTKFLADKLTSLGIRIKAAKGQTKNFSREVKALNALKLLNIENAYTSFGIVSQTAMKNTAKSSREAFGVLKLGEPSIADLASAFGKVAIAETKANNGIVSNSLKTEAAIYGVSLALNEQGELAVQSINIFHDKVDKLSTVSKDFKEQLALTNASSFDEFEASLTKNLKAVSDEAIDFKSVIEGLKVKLNDLDKPDTLEGTKLKERISKVQEKIDQAESKARKFKNTLDELDEIKLTNVEKAFRKLGLIAKSELERIAENSQSAFDIIAESEDDIDKLATAFTKVAQTSKDANEGIVSDAIRQQAIQNDLILVVTKQGKVIAKTAEEFDVFTDVTLNSASEVNKLLGRVENADASALGETFVKTATVVREELGSVKGGVDNTVDSINKANIEPFQTSVTESANEAKNKIVELSNASLGLVTAINNVSSEGVFELRDSYVELGVTSKEVMASNVADAKESYSNIANSGTASAREIALATKNLHKIIGENSEQVIVVQKAFDDLGITASKVLEDNALNAVKSYEVLRDSGVASLAELEAASYRVTEATDAITESNQLLSNEYSTLGITSGENLEILAKKAEAAYQTIKTSGVASAQEISRAYVASQEIQRQSKQVVTELSKAYADLGITSRKALIDNGVKAARAYEVLKESGKASLFELQEASHVLEVANKKLADSTNLLTRDYQTLGIKSTQSLQDHAFKAVKAYEKIKNSGIASANDIALAEREMNKARREVTNIVTDLSLAYDELGIKSHKVLVQDALDATNAYQKLKDSGKASLSELERAAYKVEKANKTIIDSTQLLTREYSLLGVKSSKQLEDQAAKAKIAYEKIRDSGTASQYDIQQALEKSKEIAKTVYQEVDVVAKAYKQLGIATTSSFAEAEQQAIRSYDIIKNSGTASARDIQLAYEKVNEATNAVLENNTGLIKSFSSLGVKSSQSLTLIKEEAERSYRAIRDSGVATSRDIEKSYISMANTYLSQTDGIISKQLLVEAAHAKAVITINEEGEAQATSKNEYRKKVIEQLKGDLATNNSTYQVKKTQDELNREIAKAKKAYIANAIASGEMRDSVISDANAIEKAQRLLLKSIISDEQARLRAAQSADQRAIDSARRMRSIINKLSDSSSKKQIKDIESVASARQKAVKESADSAFDSLDGILSSFNGKDVTNNIPLKMKRWADALEEDKAETTVQLQRVAQSRNILATEVLALRDQLLVGVQGLRKNRELVDADTKKQIELRNALVERNNITSGNLVASKADDKGYTDSLVQSTNFQRSRTAHDNAVSKQLTTSNTENQRQHENLNRAAKTHAATISKLHSESVTNANDFNKANSAEIKRVAEISKQQREGNAASRATYAAGLLADTSRANAENEKQAQNLNRAEKNHSDKMATLHAQSVANANDYNSAVKTYHNKIEATGKVIRDGNAAGRARYAASLLAEQLGFEKERERQAANLDRAAKNHADKMARIHTSNVKNANEYNQAVKARHKEIEETSKIIREGNAAGRARYAASLLADITRTNAENERQAANLDRAAKKHALAMSNIHTLNVKNANEYNQAVKARHKEIEEISKIIREGNAASRAKFQAERDAELEAHRSSNIAKNIKYAADSKKEIADAKALNDKINQTLEGGEGEVERIRKRIEAFKKFKEADAKAKQEQEKLEQARLDEIDRQHESFLLEKKREEEVLAAKRQKNNERGNSSITRTVVGKDREKVVTKPHVVQTKKISLDLTLNGRTVPTTFTDNAETRAFINELEQSGKLV